MTDAGETRADCSSSAVSSRLSGTESDWMGSSVTLVSPPEDDE